MNTTAKELALGGMFTALGVVLLCLGGVVPLALYACPILASAVLLPVRERCRKQVAWSCYAAIALLGTRRAAGSGGQENGTAGANAEKRRFGARDPAHIGLALLSENRSPWIAGARVYSDRPDR